IAEQTGLIWRVHHAFERRFESFRQRYHRAVEWSVHHRIWIAGLFAVFVLGSLTLAFVVGRDFFPYVDAAQIKMHVRAPEGTRIERTERIFADIEQEIRKIIPAQDLETLLDNIGLPNSGINLAFGDTANVSAADGDILISLNPNKHTGTQEYERALRDRLRALFPDEIFFFQPANITNQILNFGLLMPIDIQITGRDAAANYAMALDLRRRIAE